MNIAVSTLGRRMTAFDPSGADVLSFAREEALAGRPTAIATLINIEGSSPRAPGAQVAVAEDGRSRGSISSGCLERAIIDEARAAISRGFGGVVRYGRNSPFVDVKLPCGSGVDILFTVSARHDAVVEAAEALKRREPATLAFSPTLVIGAAAAENGAFHRAYRPPVRIVAAGYGPELSMLCQLSSAAGYHAIALSPDEATLLRCEAAESTHLKTPYSPPDVAIDRWTACVLLFHDRDWESALLGRFLKSPAFYVGAVGGRKTSAARLDALNERGFTQEALRKLSAPIGLIPMTRDPSALGVSILAEIVAAASTLT